MDRRALLKGLTAVGTGLAIQQASAQNVTNIKTITKVSSRDIKAHEVRMQLALDQAQNVPKYPFGCVIFNKNTGQLVAQGYNKAGLNPSYHGEIDALNNYVNRNGNQGWEDLILYTTGEPCPMCMSAIIWAGIKNVVWASSIETILKSGIGQIMIPASEVANRSIGFYSAELLLGGVLAHKCDKVMLKSADFRM